MAATRRGACSLCGTTTTKGTSEHLDGGMKRRNRTEDQLHVRTDEPSVERKRKAGNLTFLHRCCIIAYYILGYSASYTFSLHFPAEKGSVLLTTFIYMPPMS